jgi:hypothetical protein
MKITRYNLSVDDVPVDFFADPDGSWSFDELVEASGFEPDRPGVCVGALTESFLGHPEGSAVVTEMGRLRPYVAIVNLSKLAQPAPSILGDSSRGRVHSVHVVGGRSAA